MIIIIVNYNTYRKSPYGGTWQDTIFKCLKKFPNIKTMVVDWGSDDGSDISARKRCEQEGYLYKKISIKGSGFSWFEYMRVWQKHILKNINHKNILYVESDTYICGDEDQLIKSKNILDNNDIGLVKLTRLDSDGIIPFYIEKHIDNGFLLPKFEYNKHYLKFNKKHDELLSSRKIVRRCWHNWDIKCTLFKTSCLDYSISRLRTLNVRKDKKRGFYNLGKVFCSRYRCAIGDYIFSYNYGSRPLEDYKKAISICDNYSDCKITDICKQSILNFNEGVI